MLQYDVTKFLEIFLIPKELFTDEIIDINNVTTITNA